MDKLWKYQDICMFIFRSVGLSSGLVQNKPWDPSIVFFCRCLRVVEVLSCGTLFQTRLNIANDPTISDKVRRDALGELRALNKEIQKVKFVDTKPFENLDLKKKYWLQI